MDYIAHIADEREQSVAMHCAGTAEKAGTYAAEFHMGTAGYLQGLLHDMGKFCADFTDYIKGDSRFYRGEIDHAYAGAKYLTDLASGTQDATMQETAELIARTIISHHGLHDWIQRDKSLYFPERIAKTERYEEICEAAELNDTELLALLEKAAAEYMQIKCAIHTMAGRMGKNKRDSFFFYLGMAERLMQSVLIDADRTDTADFMSDTATEYTCDVQAVWAKMSRNIEDLYTKFRARTDAVSVCRTDIADRCKLFATHPVGICRLIVPTGGGKTLSSLRFAIHYAERYHMQRIFYIAPFMSILEQNSDIIKSIAGEEHCLEHYSDILQQLDTGEELAEYELRSQKWDKPVIATTLVQFFNALYDGSLSAVRRMHRLAQSVIIIDEIQSIPLNCVNLFNLAVNFLSNVCGATVVLCSATQPCLEDTQFPILLDDKESMTGDYRADFASLRRVQLVSAIRPNGYPYQEAAAFCIAKAAEAGDLMLVVNTKAAAAELYRRLKEQTPADTRLLHLSTNMCPEHRKKSIQDIKAALEQRQRLICVTTQLIEAGVDISFRCVVRSLAGLENAAQAAGRCNREGKEPLCYTYIINLCDENLQKLQEIVQRQGVSRMVIGTGQYDDLLDTAAMHAYFFKLYQEQTVQLSYPIEDAGLKTTLIDLLSWGRVPKKNKSVLARQAFSTAGKEFQLFDSQTSDIIVPYNEEAEEIIATLNGVLTPEQAEKALRRAQKYTVGVFADGLKRLMDNGAVYPLFCGALALKKEFYDADGVGLQMVENAKPKPLVL